MDTFERCLARVQGYRYLCVNTYASGHNGRYHVDRVWEGAVFNPRMERNGGSGIHILLFQRSVDAFVCLGTSPFFCNSSKQQ